MRFSAPNVSFRHMRSILHAMERRGYSKSDLDKHFPMPDLPSGYSIDEFRLPANQFLDALHQAIKLTGDPLFALHAGMNTELADYSIIGNLISNTQTYQQSYDVYLKYQYILSNILHTRCIRQESYNQYIFSSQYYLGDYVRPYSELRLAGNIRLTNIITGNRNLTFRRIYCQHAPAAEESRYAEVLGYVVDFNQATSGCDISHDFLNTSTIEPDDDIFEFSVRKADYLLGLLGQQQTCSERVRFLLEKRLGIEDTQLSKIAELLSTSESTLKRNLAAEKTTFSNLLAQVRLDRAQQMISNQELSLEDIAFKCGYKDYTSLSKAFKKLTGKTPSELRRVWLVS